MTDSPAIELRGVVKTYQAGRRALHALRGVDLLVERGEYVAVVGPSGCGKSTLLNLIAGLDTADAGEAYMLGYDVGHAGQDQLARWRGRNLGIVFQFFKLMPTLTARENVLLPMDLAGERRAKRARADQLLSDVGLTHLADHLPSELSGGEQQRVAIARALANEPALIVADEPTGNLDSATGERIIELIEQLWQAGATLVLVTHDPAVARRAPRMVTMRDGLIVSDTGAKPRDVSTFAATVSPARQHADAAS
jgi:putative ABC transport system ATP-binding protein